MRNAFGRSICAAPSVADFSHRIGMIVLHASGGFLFKCEQRDVNALLPGNE